MKMLYIDFVIGVIDMVLNLVDFKILYVVSY